MPVVPRRPEAAQQRPPRHPLAAPASRPGDASTRAATRSAADATARGGALPADQGSGERVLAYLESTAGNRAAAHVVQREPGARRQQDPNLVPATIEEAARDRIKDWRIAAGEGLQDFVDSELFNAVRAKEADWRGFGMSLAGNLLWATACFGTGGAAFALSALGIALAAMGTVPSSSAPRTADPAELTKVALRRIVVAVQEAAYDAIPGVVSGADASWLQDRDKSVEYTLLHIFDPKFLMARNVSGILAEINQPAVSAEFRRQASDHLARYKDQVQPVGSEEWGHWKVVPVQLRDDGRYVLCRRRLDDDRDVYEFVRWIDADMAQAARARGDEADEALTVIDESSIENFPHVPRTLPRSYLPSHP